MKQVYISTGSNLNNPLKQTKKAIKELNKLHETKIIKISSFYKSKPIGPKNQPDYLNTIICLKTNLTPIVLLKKIQKIEKKQGRIRKKNRWGPRTIDLDIILYDKITIKKKN